MFSLKRRASFNKLSRCSFRLMNHKIIKFPTVKAHLIGKMILVMSWRRNNRVQVKFIRRRNMLLNLKERNGFCMLMRRNNLGKTFVKTVWWWNLRILSNGGSNYNLLIILIKKKKMQVWLTIIFQIHRCRNHLIIRAKFLIKN